MELDALTQALLKYARQWVTVEWGGLAVRGFLADIMYAYDMEDTDFDAWLLDGIEIIKHDGVRTICGVRSVNGNPLSLTQDDPPLRVIAPDGSVVWQQETGGRH